jgi:hypothetical protein
VGPIGIKIIFIKANTPIRQAQKNIIKSTIKISGSTLVTFKNNHQGININVTRLRVAPTIVII